MHVFLPACLSKNLLIRDCLLVCRYSARWLLIQTAAFFSTCAFAGAILVKYLFIYLFKQKTDEITANQVRTKCENALSMKIIQMIYIYRTVRMHCWTLNRHIKTHISVTQENHLPLKFKSHEVDSKAFIIKKMPQTCINYKYNLLAFNLRKGFLVAVFEYIYCWRGACFY